MRSFKNKSVIMPLFASTLMIVFYVSESTTQVIRWWYWNETFVISFHNNTSYRVAVFTQMLINISCLALILIWRAEKNIHLEWRHVIPIIYCFLLLILFICEFIASLIDSSEVKSFDNLTYLIQTVIDLCRYGFSILYYTFR